MRMSDEYLAGLIDGEGCIGIYRYGKNTVRPVIVVSMTDPAPIEAVAERYGLTVTFPFIPQPNRPAYRVSAYGYNAVKMARDIYPYLLVKSDQAALVLAWAYLKDNNELSPEKDQWFTERSALLNGRRNQQVTN